MHRRKGQIVKHIKMWKQIEVLEYHSYTWFLAGSEDDLSGIRLHKTCQTTQQRTFTTAYRPDKTHHFLLGKLQGEVVQDLMVFK
jgi:hypothetical protein